MVKATFELVHGEAARLIAPLDLVREDRYRRPSGSLEEAKETAPYLPNVGIVLSGHAHAPPTQPVTSTTVRLAIARERRLLDKTLHVFGERTPAAAMSPQPFQKMPLVYERAHGGAGNPENPAGAASLPSIVDPGDPRRPAGFGPIARHWPARRRLLGSFDERALEAPVAEIPEGFDWRYFQSAPADQQLERLHGDEWLVLDGMHPTLPRLQTRLPSAVARARWSLMTAAGSYQGHPIELRADTLVIDADRRLCSLIWRGCFVLERADAAPWVRIVAGVELPGQAIRWPEPPSVSSGPIALAATMELRNPLDTLAEPPRAAAPSALTETSQLDMQAIVASLLPFAPSDSRKLEPAPSQRAAWTPGVARAPESLTGTANFDLSQVLAAVVPFTSATPSAPGLGPSPLASTGGLDMSLLRPALPFEPFDPAKAPFEPERDSVSRPAPPRSSQPFSGTADVDTQRAIRAILPFPAEPQPMFSVPEAVEPEREAILPPEREALPPAWPIAPPLLVPAPPLLVVAVPVVAPLVVAPPPVAAPILAAPPPVEPATPVKASPPAAAPDVRAQVIARLEAGQSFQGLSLVGADLQQIDFRGASLAGLDLRRAKLQRANLSRAQAAEVNLEGADLTEAKLEGADLTRANLARANVTQVCFDNAILTGANLQRLVGSAPSFRAAKLQGADLRQAQAPHAVFDDAVLRNASTMKADLSGARFVRADLSGANLRDTKLREANLSHANLEGANLSDADLTRANVHGAARKTAKISPAQAKCLVEIDPAQDSMSRKEG
jgi:uncharacterized protein YjbI with pentapeptide repeats